MTLSRSNPIFIDRKLDSDWDCCMADRQAVQARFVNGDRIGPLSATKPSREIESTFGSSPSTFSNTVFTAESPVRKPGLSTWQMMENTGCSDDEATHIAANTCSNFALEKGCRSKRFTSVSFIVWSKESCCDWSICVQYFQINLWSPMPRKNTMVSFAVYNDGKH